MARRRGGIRRKGRVTFAKRIRRKGKVPIKRYFAEFSPGEMVLIDPEPFFQNMPQRKFRGKMAVINKKQGDSYEVSINDKGKVKKLYIHPVHLAKAKAVVPVKAVVPAKAEQ